MRINYFGENADVGKWTFCGGNLTWGNSELKMGDHPQNDPDLFLFDHHLDYLERNK